MEEKNAFPLFRSHVLHLNRLQYNEYVYAKKNDEWLATKIVNKNYYILKEGEEVKNECK